jgi:hypothetical protein
MENEPKCDNKEPHSHLVAGRTFECEKGQQEKKTYDIDNLDKFDEKFTHKLHIATHNKENYSGLDIQVDGEWEHIKSFILKDRQEAYNAGRQSGLEEVEKMLIDEIAGASMNSERTSRLTRLCNQINKLK